MAKADKVESEKKQDVPAAAPPKVVPKTKEPAKYRALNDGYLHGGLGQVIEKRTVFDYAGKPGKWMHPMNAAAEEAVAAAKKGAKFPSRAESRRSGEKVGALKAANVSKPLQVKDDPNSHGTKPKPQGEAERREALGTEDDEA